MRRRMMYSIGQPSTLYNGLKLNAEFDGDVTDGTGVNNGTATNVTFVSTPVGQAASVTGTGYVLFPMNAFSDTEFTFSCKVKFSTVTGTQVLFSTYAYPPTPNGNGFYIGIDSAKFYMALCYTNSANVDIYSSSSVSTGVWYLLTMTHKSGVTKIYIDAVLDVTNSHGHTPFYDTNNHYPAMGGIKYSSSSVSPSLNGSVKEFRYWNRELTSTEITQLLTARYPF